MVKANKRNLLPDRKKLDTKTNTNIDNANFNFTYANLRNQTAQRCI